ncbi:hypothetical protein NG54_12510 [Heyndrickxia ginsengihumi]|uniref:DUF111 family protein n=1 Tax=Heyndrickxia ginsengihumi TaxID=363870 RepID=A0A0A6VBQ2_9BACI|nr:nickel insertion protein [Heyndrickxia ginsengihumi]KHD84918.1 hypothetical protein NG54_12510 [Heyndrickxia ginsengihumi]
MAGFSHRYEHTDDDMVKIEVNLDDTLGEWLGYIMDELLNLGANDVYYTPIYMKKNRPAILLSVICTNERLNDIKSYIFRETTTLGIRYFPLSVHRLERRFYSLQTELGEISIKEGLHNGKVVQVAPEYEDWKKIAVEHNIPLKEVYQKVWNHL